MFTPGIRSAATLAVLGCLAVAGASLADGANGSTPAQRQQTATNNGVLATSCGKAGRDGQDGRNGASTNSGVGGKGGKGGKGGSVNCSTQNVNGQ